MTASNLIHQPAFIVENNGRYQVTRAVTQGDILDMAKIIIEQQFFKSPAVNTVELAVQYFRLNMATLTEEILLVAFLDKKLHPIACEKLFHGTVDRCHIYPREILKAVIKHNACSVMLAHNHPSGNAIPSNSDKLITSTLVKALGLIEVTVSDHIIIAGNEFYSFAQHGEDCLS